MSLLVLGGGGAVGSAIVRRAAAAGLDVHAVLRPSTDPIRLDPCHTVVTIHRLDIADTARLTEVVEQVRPRHVVAAAFPAHPATGWDADQRGATAGAVIGNLLSTSEALRSAGGDVRFVLLGSLMVYGRGGRSRHPDHPTRPQTFRGALKAAESALAFQFAEETGTEFVELRLGSVYGPFQPRRRLITELMRTALLGERLRVVAEPVLRDWIHFDDVAGACLVATDAKRSRSPLVAHVASGEVHSLRDIVSIAERVVGRPLAHDEPSKAIDRYGDVEPALLAPPEEFDWRPTVTLDDGIAEYWDWARSPIGRHYLLDGAVR